MAELETIDEPMHAAGAESPAPSDPVASGAQTPAPAASASSADRAADPRPTPTRLTATQQIQRAGVALLAGAICAALLAPVVVALLTALAALLLDALALVDIGRLLARGALMQLDTPLQAMSVVSRLGLVAIGYLGLVCALITLLAGLLGRGRGRLYIVPGALLTASALALLVASAALCWSLLAPFARVAPPGALLALALYLTLDTVALATLLADTRQTRRQWRRARASGRRRRGPTPTTPPPALTAGA